MEEQFVWKTDGKIFKGVGIYHLTFVVAGRRRLLGEIVGEVPEKVPAVERPCDMNAGVRTAGAGAAVERPCDMNAGVRTAGAGAAVERPCDMNAGSLMAGDMAAAVRVRLTPYGMAVDDMLRHFDRDHEGIKVCKRIVMDDHVHIVLWVQKQQYSTVQHKPQSILQIAYGMRVQFTHMAQEMGLWPKGVRVAGALHAEKGAGHVFERQFVRTLSRKGQLSMMCNYVALNPYRKYMRRQHPDLFTMHKETVVGGLRYRSMGNHWLLDWPERQVVMCSRSMSEEAVQRQLEQVMARAELGAVTYTAAKSMGERVIARAVREAGWPLVVLMLDGFPPAGSEGERHYKPGGVYFDACLNGKLLLLEAYEENYENPWVIERTEAMLKQKEEAKGRTYRPLPHDSVRWRMMAGNVMVERCVEWQG